MNWKPQPVLYLLKIQAPKIKVAVLAINESIVQNQLEQRQIDFALVIPDFQAPNIHAKNWFGTNGHIPAYRWVKEQIEKACLVDDEK